MRLSFSLSRTLTYTSAYRCRIRFSFTTAARDSSFPFVPPPPPPRASASRSPSPRSRPLLAVLFALFSSCIPLRTLLALYFSLSLSLCRCTRRRARICTRRLSPTKRDRAPSPSRSPLSSFLLFYLSIVRNVGSFHLLLAYPLYLRTSARTRYRCNVLALSGCVLHLEGAVQLPTNVCAPISSRSFFPSPFSTPVKDRFFCTKNVREYVGARCMNAITVAVSFFLRALVLRKCI